MIIRTLSTLTRRLATALVIGAAAAAVPAIALAASPSPTPVAAAAAPSGPAASLQPAAAPALQVVSGAIALAVDKRNPLGVADAFQPSAGALYAWVKVKNLGDATTLTMVWKKDGKHKLSVPLPVGHAWGWKTWSKKGIGEKDAGRWTVEVVDAHNQVLETLAFTVDPSAPAVTVGALQ